MLLFLMLCIDCQAKQRSVTVTPTPSEPILTYSVISLATPVMANTTTIPLIPSPAAPTSIPTPTVEVLDSNPNDLVTEENHCAIPVPFNPASISSGSIPVQNGKNYALMNPKDGILRQLAAWNWMDTDKQGITMQVSPDKNSTVIGKYYIDDNGKSSDDLMVYGLHMELVNQLVIQDYGVSFYWLDNEHIIFNYTTLSGHFIFSDQYHIWNPYTNQQTIQTFPIKYYIAPEYDSRAILFNWHVVFNPTLTIATYLNQKQVPQAVNLKNQKKVWSYDGTYFNNPPKWSPDGQMLALLMLDNNRLRLDMLILDGNLQNWVDIEQKIVSTDIPSSLYNTRIMSWSPDSRYLAFFGGEYELFILDLQKKILIHSCIKHTDWMIYWSLDSKQIIFQISENHIYHNYILDIQSKNLMRLPEPLGKVHSPNEWIANGE